MYFRFGAGRIAYIIDLNMWDLKLNFETFCISSTKQFCWRFVC